MTIFRSHASGSDSQDNNSAAEVEECDPEGGSTDERQTWRRAVGSGDTSG